MPAAFKQFFDIGSVLPTADVLPAPGGLSRRPTDEPPPTGQTVPGERRFVMSAKGNSGHPRTRHRQKPLADRVSNDSNLGWRAEPRLAHLAPSAFSCCLVGNV